MNRMFLLSLAIYACTQGLTLAAPPAAHPLAPPYDIIFTVSRLTIPRVDIREPTTLREALTFIYKKRIFDDSEFDSAFVFEYRLPEAILQRHVSFKARDITMLEALRLALKDIPVKLTFETGKLIISQPPSEKDDSAAKGNP